MVTMIVNNFSLKGMHFKLAVLFSSISMKFHSDLKRNQNIMSLYLEYKIVSFYLDQRKNIRTEFSYIFYCNLQLQKFGEQFKEELLYIMRKGKYTLG